MSTEWKWPQNWTECFRLTSGPNMEQYNIVLYETWNISHFNITKCVCIVHQCTHTHVPCTNLSNLMYYYTIKIIIILLLLKFKCLVRVYKLYIPEADGVRKRIGQPTILLRTFRALSAICVHREWQVTYYNKSCVHPKSKPLKCSASKLRRSEEWKQASNKTITATCAI